MDCIRALQGLLLSTAVILSACSAPPPSSTSQSATPQNLSTAYTLKSGGQIPRYQQGVTVEHAELHFAFDFDKEQLFGNTILTLQAAQPAKAVSVDLDSVFTIDGVWLNGERISPQRYTNEQGELVITPANEVSFPVSVQVKYHGHPRTPPNAPWDGGVMWDKTPDGAPWLATAVQGEGCDIFWACIDQPMGEPKTADIYITVPNNLVAASNGVLVKTTSTDNESTYHWQTRSAHNTYGIALNIAPYEKIEESYQSIYGNRYPIVYYHLPGNAEKARQLFNEIPAMLTFFERMIGPYPFADEKVGP